MSLSESTSSSPSKGLVLTASISAMAVPERMMTKTLRCAFNLLEIDLSTGHQRKSKSESLSVTGMPSWKTDSAAANTPH